MNGTTELAQDLTAIHEQRTELLHQAPQLTDQCAYGDWLAPITMALSDDHHDLGRGTGSEDAAGLNRPMPGIGDPRTLRPTSHVLAIH